MAMRWWLACAVAPAVMMSGCERQDARKPAASIPASGARYAVLDTWPDWSGVWALSDESFYQGVLVDTGALPSSEAGASTIPLRPEYLSTWRKMAKLGASAGNAVRCLPDGMPGLMQHPMMTEYLFTPGRVTVMFENGEARRIFTDGRAHPAADELEYGFEGHSIGRWENAVLVVDTLGISERADLLLNNDLRTTRKTHVAERIFLKDKDTLQIDTVVTDPELFTGPYAYSRFYQRTPLPFTDGGCAANNRDNDAAVDLTPPAAR